MRVALLVTLVALAGSQQPAPAPQTFRSGTQIVEVDVRVVGKDGRFVTDLGPADFEIAEDGAAQKIQSVTLISAVPFAPQAPVAPQAPQAPLAPLAPPAPHAPPQTWLFVFDTGHLSPGGLTRTRDAVVKFITERFRQGDLGGVVADGKMINNRLTSDRDELRAASASVRLPGELRSRQLELREWPRLQDELEAFRIARNERDAIQAAVNRACADDPDACRRVPPDLQVRTKATQLVAAYRTATLQTLAVVDVLSKGLARMAGPKTVVFLSEGFVLEEQEAQLRQAVGQAARAGAHFYTIDARGLNKGTNAQLIDQALADNAAGAPGRFDMQADGTNSLAVDTGGFAIRNENNFGRALDEIQRDAGTYYVISYAAANEVFDGKYRTISVKVARPGVKVRARRGYLAIEPAKMLTPVRALSPTGKEPAPPVEPPAVPVSPGMIALPETIGAPLPGEVAVTRVADAPHPDTAMRARIDAGQMVLALGKPAADASPPGSVASGSAVKTAAELGWAAYEKGDVESAARDLGEAALAPDARPWVLYALGLSHFALRRHHDAASAWERVRRDVPEFEPIYFSLADAYGLQHDEGSALKVLREAERRWPADAEVANAIGVIQIRRGALDAAIESFERATRIDPADALGYFNLARTHQMRLLKSQRYDRQMQKWIGGDEDRRRAVSNFEKYVQLGGPYQRQAQDALASLAWK